jgi:hypothetical protein
MIRCRRRGDGTYTAANVPATRGYNPLMRRKVRKIEADLSEQLEAFRRTEHRHYKSYRALAEAQDHLAEPSQIPTRNSLRSNSTRGVHKTSARPTTDH